MTHKSHSLSFIFLCAALFFQGCAVVSSSDVNPSVIYSSYGAKYDEATSQVALTAEFFVGGETGTYVELDDKSSVTLNSAPMTKDKTIINQIIYESSQYAAPGSTNSVYTFTYTDDSGAVYQNDAKIPGRIGLVNKSPGGLSVSQGFGLTWQADTSVDSSETVTGELKSMGGTVASGWGESGGTRGQVLFSPSSLAGFPPGPATLVICRRNTYTGIQASKAGGSLTTSYCAAPVSVTVVQ